MQKASKFAKDVFVNFLLFNNNEHFIKKQRHTLNIHTVCIQLKLFEAGSAGSLYNCYDVELCNLQYLLGIETIFTKNLSQFGWVFANLFRVRELFKVASELERLTVSRILIFLLSSFRSSLHLTEEFYYYHLSLLCFRFAALRPDHIPLADFQIKRPKESIQEPPLNQTTLDYQIPPQIRQQQTMIRPDQTTTATPDHQITSPPYLTTQHPISTAYPTS